MTNVAFIQAKIYKGYGKAARKLGSNHSFYRGSIATSSLTDQNGNPLQGQDGAPLGPQGANDLLLDQNGMPLQAQDGSNLEDQSSNAGDPLLDQSGQPLLDQNGQVLTAQTNTGPSPTSLAPYGSGLVSFNAEDMGYKKPNKYGKPTWYAVFDGTNATVGDYIVGPQGTFFIAAMQPLLPILVVECNRVVTISTPQDQTTGNGLQGYAGSSSASETPIMTGWPASLLQGTKGEKTDAKLPGDTRAPWWALLLPYLEGVTINFGDIVSDDLGRRYIVSSAELSDLGWKITAEEAVP